MEPIPDPALIDTLLERILASEGFRRSDRQTALLRFLVTRVCQGHPEPVKEYELGIEVFGRPISYDPRTDPIVRVGMRELRTRLSLLRNRRCHGPDPNRAAERPLPRGVHVAGASP